MGNDTDQILHELFGPSLRRERKTPFLTLYNPWTRLYHLYRAGPDGLVMFRTFGSLNLCDAKRIERSLEEDGA